MSYTNDLSSSNLTSIIASAIGAFGASVVVISCHRYQKLSRTLSRKLIASQSLAHLIETLAILFLPSTNHATCVLQGVIEEYAVYAGIFWGCLMTYLLIILTRKQIGNVETLQHENFLFYARLIGWILPLPLSLIPLITSDYARDAGGWCWFKDSTSTGRFFRFFHYSIVFLCVVFITGSSLRIYFSLSGALATPDKGETTQSPFEYPSKAPSPPPSPTNRPSIELFRESSGSINATSWRLLPTSVRNRLSVSIPEARSKLSSRLIYFPIVLVMCYSCLTLHRFWDLLRTTNSSPPNILLIIGIALARAQGFFDLILFSSQQSVRREWLADLECLRGTYRHRHQAQRESNISSPANYSEGESIRNPDSPHPGVLTGLDIEK